MSDHLVIDSSASVSRQPRRDRADRQPNYQRDRPAEPTIEVADNPSPESVIADGARQLQERDREVAESRRRETEARQREQTARQEADQARQTQHQDRQAIVAQALEGAKSEQTAARATLKAAREAGDVDAEMGAVETLSAATYRVTQASAELEAMKAQPRPQPQRTQQSAPRISDRAQQWLNEHPRYNADMPYRALAQYAHNEAIGQGHSAESQDYIDHIERVLTAQYGQDHGQVPRPQTQRGREEVPADRGRGPSAQDGVPPSRGSGGGNGGFSAVKTVLHKDPVMVQKGANGAMRIRFSSTEQRKDFQEGADTCRMSLGDYVLDHINVADEIARGESGDLVRGEGAKFE